MGIPHQAMAQIQIKKLPPPLTQGDVSIEETIAKRRSRRAFQDKPLTLQQISQLLWAAQGITQKERGFRAAPSAGALYPMEIYILTEEGFFHYVPQTHSLEVIGSVDMRESLTAAALGQRAVLQAPLSILICAEYKRVTRKYVRPGVKYVHMEAGHIAQNIHLQAVALGLGSLPVGAFDADEVKENFPIPKEWEPIYIIPVGYAR